ncbi:MAG: NADH-quinone oxidoreductase subunit J [Candidatus Kapabacteria bacterium]|nr:NADH-quinone oxidoreductase subunit J [Candidatus Kapabacteria bacterium]
MPSLQVLLFILLGIGAIATSVATITRRNPVASAMNLVAHFFMLFGLYLTLQAQFVAIVQILVYAGAIMVLVIFVIMLLNLGKEQSLDEKFSPYKVLGMIMASAFVVMMMSMILGKPSGYTQLSDKALANGTTESIGNVLFTQYLFPFEIISLLLLAALIGAVVLANRTAVK